VAAEGAAIHQYAGRRGFPDALQQAAQVVEQAGRIAEMAELTGRLMDFRHARGAEVEAFPIGVRIFIRLNPDCCHQDLGEGLCQK
jgi:hypothetical protein